MQGSSVVFCHLWPVPLHDIFFLQNYLINGTIFGEKLLNTKCVFWFSLQLLSETFLILRGIQRCVINARRTCVISGFHHEVDENSPLLGYNPEEGSSPYIDIYVKYPLFLSNLNETWISSSYFREILKFHETPSSESLVVPCRRTDGRTDGHADRQMNKLTVTFCNVSSAPEVQKRLRLKCSGSNVAVKLVCPGRINVCEIYSKVRPWSLSRGGCVPLITLQSINAVLWQSQLQSCEIIRTAANSSRVQAEPYGSNSKSRGPFASDTADIMSQWQVCVVW